MTPAVVFLISYFQSLETLDSFISRKTILPTSVTNARRNDERI